MAVLVVFLLLVSQVNTVACSPDGTRIVVGGCDKKVHVLDEATGKECYCIDFADRVRAHAALLGWCLFSSGDAGSAATGVIMAMCDLL